MSRRRTIIRLSAVLAVVALAKGCGDGDSPTAPPPVPDPPRPTTVTVSPATNELTALGTTVQLSAEVRDQNARVMAAATVTWTSSANSVATVNASGLVRAAGNGTATITASAGSGQGTAEITVMDLERAALIALYEATDGPNWVNSENWLTDAPLGDWFGVRTDASGRVVGLAMSNYDSQLDRWISNNVKGPIPPELGDLTELEYLQFFNNSLSGPIPSELGRLTNLRDLDFNSNELTGPIPSELGRLTNLESLYLSGNELTGPILPELGRLANLERLSLRSNRLTGPIPTELGGLANLALLELHGNALTDPIPSSFLQLGGLDRFYIAGNESLCVPGIRAFAAWLEGIEYRDETTLYCNAWDAAVLDSLYETAGGSAWTHSTGWRASPVLEEWYGVDADSLGRVTGLDLSNNGLSGKIPASLSELAGLTVLRINGNDLSGRLPLALTALSLRELHYADTELCAPTNESFREWLKTIGSHEGTDVECGPTFSLSGTVSDSRRNGPMLVGAVFVRLENGRQESMTTGPDGHYSFENVWGTVTVTVTAEPSYVAEIVEITVDEDRTLDFDLEHTGTPPYYGSVGIWPQLFDSSDPTTLGSITYAGRGQRPVYDRRPDRGTTIDAYLFDVRYAEHVVEFRVNPEFGSPETAQAEVETYAPALGQMPAVLLSGITYVSINAGNLPWGGCGPIHGCGGILIHTERGTEKYMLYGWMEEVMFHETAHSSLDIAHRRSPGWLAAQAADGVSISEYARDHPNREDIAESFLSYFAVRYRPERLTDAERAVILTTIPNRLIYFDEQGFDMSPYVATESTAPILGVSPFQARPQLWRPFEGPPVR